MASSEDLRSHVLEDVVIQGHAIRLRDIPCKAFTLSGRHDNWQVSAAVGMFAIPFLQEGNFLQTSESPSVAEKWVGGIPVATRKDWCLFHSMGKVLLARHGIPS